MTYDSTIHNTVYIMNEGYIMYTVLYDSFKQQPFPLQLIIMMASILTVPNYHTLDFLVLTTNNFAFSQHIYFEMLFLVD